MHAGNEVCSLPLSLPQRHSPKPWTPLAAQSSPQSHHERGARRVNVFAGWGEGGKELTREITAYYPRHR
jgi:hypothetical protein